MKLETLEFKFAGDIQKYTSDKDVSKYTHMPYPYPKDGAVQFIQNSIERREEGGFINFGATLDSNFVGIAGLTLIDEDQNGKIAEIGYWIGKSFWNRA